MMTHVNFSRALIWGNVATTVACTSLFQLPAQSIQLADGTTYFANVPRLENAAPHLIVRGYLGRPITLP